MEKLNVRFGDTQKLKLDDVAGVLGINQSDVARAALYIGLKEILALASTNKDRGAEFTLLNALRAKQ